MFDVGNILTVLKPWNQICHTRWGLITPWISEHLCKVVVSIDVTPYLRYNSCKTNKIWIFKKLDGIYYYYCDIAILHSLKIPLHNGIGLVPWGISLVFFFGTQQQGGHNFLMNSWHILIVFAVLMLFVWCFKLKFGVLIFVY